MNFRWIQGEELERLRPVFEAYGWTNMDPVFSKALVAEDEAGEIIGFNALQAIIRPEPLWVAKHHRGSDLAKILAAKTCEYLKRSGVGYWEVRVESPFVEKLCIENGMERINVPMYKGGTE